MFENKTVKELIFLIKKREISIKELNKYYLDKINTGEIGIYNNSLELITYNAGDTIFSNTMNYNPTFTMLNSTLQQIDSDRLDDELDAVDNEDYNPALY